MRTRCELWSSYAMECYEVIKGNEGQICSDMERWYIVDLKNQPAVNYVYRLWLYKREIIYVDLCICRKRKVAGRLSMRRIFSLCILFPLFDPCACIIYSKLNFWKLSKFYSLEFNQQIFIKNMSCLSHPLAHE